MSDQQQWWQGGDAHWRQGPVPPGFTRGSDGRWYPEGAPFPGPATGSTGPATAAAGAAASAADTVATATVAAPIGAAPDAFPASDVFPASGAAPADGGVLAGLRAWPRSAKVTVGVLAAWALLVTAALGGAPSDEADREDDVRALARSVEATVPTTAAPATTTTTTAPTTTTTVAPTTTAPPTTAAPTTTAPPPPPTTAAPAPPPVAAPAPPTTQAPAPEPPSAYYANCDAARAAGAAPVRRGDPGYASHLDRDDDGVGCE